MSDRAVTPESIMLARMRHDRLPVPSADDIKAMKEKTARMAAKRVKQPKGKTISHADCDKAIVEAAKIGIDRTFHVVFAAMLLAQMSTRTARKLARCIEKASDMYGDHLIKDWDIEKQMWDEWGIEFQKNRTWGLKK